MPKIDIASLPSRSGSGYPAPHNEGFDSRRTTALGDPAGLTQFGVNLVTLDPGGQSSLRHWHETQDEFLVVTEGSLTLVDDQGATLLQPGDCCAFPAGDRNGHHIVNHSNAPGSFVVVGTRTKSERGWYSDIDMRVEFEDGQFNFTRKDGSPV